MSRILAAKAVGTQLPAADSVATGRAVRSGPIVVAVTIGPDRRGSVSAAPIGPAADRVSGRRVRGRARTIIVRAVRDRNRARMVTGATTGRGSAEISGLRGALPPAIPIAGGITGAA
ncbi:hypothetical protein [Nocardia jinanensis]|uniref:hypothetical protein n=1 Tax=Nocardia jinanensis TaxID=382504 RepID=UPI0016641EF1|nr:hypothetical protein [Nocardia jinanensis]